MKSPFEFRVGVERVSTVVSNDPKAPARYLAEKLRAWSTTPGVVTLGVETTAIAAGTLAGVSFEATVRLSVAAARALSASLSAARRRTPSGSPSP